MTFLELLDYLKNFEGSYGTTVEDELDFQEKYAYILNKLLELKGSNFLDIYSNIIFYIFLESNINHQVVIFGEGEPKGNIFENYIWLSFYTYLVPYGGDDFLLVIERGGEEIKRIKTKDWGLIKQSLLEL